MSRKSRIDQIVQQRLTGKETVGAITRIFLEVVAERLAAGEDVLLGGFGRFKVTRERASPYVQLTSVKGTKKKVRIQGKIKVHFRKGSALKQLLAEQLPTGETMEKYGVDTGSGRNMQKLGSNGCPQCGMPSSKLKRHGNVVICPNCGSAPFEQRSDDNDDE